MKSKLKDNFIIKIDSKNPDYLFFNVFGKEHLQKKYNNAIKIAIYSENKIPDLNYSDYSIGHSHISYLDKYYKYPTGIIISYNEKIRKIRELVLKSSIRKKFCGAVISNSSPFSNFRLSFIEELSKYKKVDMGGKYNNNVGGIVQNKINFLSSYKFSIAMENTEGDGYLTEKIFQSFLSGTIPIYYGDYMLDEYINPKSYILIKGIKDIKKKIEYIKEIDNDKSKYRKILKEKVIIDDNYVEKIENDLNTFLYNIFAQDKNKAFRKID